MKIYLILMVNVMRSFNSLHGILIFVTIATSFTSTAVAEPKLSLPPSSYETISDQFYRATFKNQRDFFYNRSAGNLINLFFGFNGYAENQYTQDAKAVDRLYTTTTLQQGSSDPTIRTPDLPNPYETSILNSPNINVYRQLGGGQ